MISVVYSKGFSYVGKRPNNEDCIMPEVCNPTDKIYVVCDGMGGHGHGEVASSTVARGFYNRLQITPINLINEDYLQRVLQQVQSDLDTADIVDEERKMGTTLVVVVIKEDGILVGHIGDSRLYQIRDGKCIFRTHDHSLVEEGVLANLITEEEARNHPKKGQLTQCIQPKPAQSAYLTIDEIKDVQTDDVLLVVTDGVVDSFTTSQLEQLCADKKDDLLANALCAQCEAVGNDNYSGFYIRLLGASKMPPIQITQKEKIKKPYQPTIITRLVQHPYVIGILILLLIFFIGVIVGHGCARTGHRTGKMQVPNIETQVQSDTTHNTLQP